MNKELLYSFDDTLEIFFSRTDWSGEIKQKKKINYTKLLQSFDVFLKYFTINNLPSPFLTQRGLIYFMNDMILRQCYPDTDVLLTAFFQTVKIPIVIKPNLNTENPKLYEDVSLPISDYLFRERYKKHSHRNENIKKEIFDYDCKRLGLQNAEQKHWYSTLLKKLSDVMPDVRTLFELEINKLDLRENFDYRNLNISLEYNMYTSWAVKLLMELSTVDKTHSPKRETQILHDLKKTRQRFFCLHLLYHIRNASFASPLTMNISDIFYVRHSDIDYSFNMMSHLGVTQSLSTVWKRQNKIAECRNAMA